MERQQADALLDVLAGSVEAYVRDVYENGRRAGLEQGRAGERASIVGWLRAPCDYGGAAEIELARRIERGEHFGQGGEL